jgi:hypothetical protein
LRFPASPCPGRGHSDYPERGNSRCPEAADKIVVSLREIRYYGDPINIEVDKRSGRRREN